MRLGQPSVSGKLGAGLLLSPLGVDLVGRLQSQLAQRQADRASIATVATLGVILLLFLAGLETDLDDLLRAGRRASLVAGGGVLATIGLVVAAAVPVGLGLRQGVFVGVMLAATSVSISVQTLLELRRLQTPLGVVVLAAAVTDDVMGLVAFSVTLAVLGVSGSSPLVLVAGLAAYFAVSLGVGLRLVDHAVNLARRLRSTEGLLGVSIAFCLLMAWLAQEAGIAAITGAYLAGLVVGRAAGRELAPRVRLLAYALPVPVFLVNVGMQIDPATFHGGAVALVAVPLVAVVAKVLGCGAAARLGGFGRGESLGVGVGMVPRGEVTLVIAVLGVQAHVLDQTGYTLGVITVLASALLTPVVLRLVLGAPPDRAQAATAAVAEASA